MLKRTEGWVKTRRQRGSEASRRRSQSWCRRERRWRRDECKRWQGAGAGAARGKGIDIGIGVGVNPSTNRNPSRMSHRLFPLPFPEHNARHFPSPWLSIDCSVLRAEAEGYVGG
jgi:hypothetical protein